MVAKAPCDEIVAVTSPTRPYCSAVNIMTRPASEPNDATAAQAHDLALASGTPWTRAIGTITSRPKPKIQATALGPPSARETRASSTEMLPQVQAVNVARRTPITSGSACRRDDGDACQER